ncbi:MAG: formyltransferase family protein [Bacteroidota bacterium]
MEQVAILASGTGSNADRLCTRFSHHPSVRIQLIACDRETAGVYEVARRHHLPCHHLSAELRKDPDALLQFFRDQGITFIVLAGYLRLIPAQVIAAYPGRIINLHPSLLPKYGGKGMHGMHVHEAVFAAREAETGITIHHVNAHYDEGAVIAQFKTKIESGDSPKRIAEKVAALEAAHFTDTVEQVILHLQEKVG